MLGFYPYQPMRNIAKIHESLAAVLIETIKRKYGFEMAPAQAEGVAKHLVKQYNHLSISALDDKSKRPLIIKELERYFATTTIPYNKYRYHSAFLFMLFIIRNNHVVVIPRFNILIKTICSRLRSILIRRK